MDVLVPEDDESKGDGDGEKADVAQERVFGYTKRPDERHGARDDRDDEGCGSKEFAYSERPGIRPKSRKRREDVGRAVSKSEKCGASLENRRPV
jgi:hypothetical protein